MERIVDKTLGFSLRRAGNALQSISEASNGDDMILKAREALKILDQETTGWTSGATISALVHDMATKRNHLTERLNELLSDPKRSSFDASYVLAAIEGRDPNKLFLARIPR